MSYSHPRSYLFTILSIHEWLLSISQISSKGVFLSLTTSKNLSYLLKKSKCIHLLYNYTNSSFIFNNTVILRYVFKF